jgi:16S rRNA (cytosine967-C5)-methyltransferase
VRLEGRAFLPSLSALRDGLASVQDESAMLVADLVDPAPGETIVDLCASPGGKALAIAERAAAGTRVIAVDRAPRLTRLRENVARLGLGGGPPDGARVEVRAGDALTLEPIPADVVLVDAPCSGLGVLRRHADLRWTKRAADVARLARVQREILDAAAAWVRPGGHLVYSTCSILREENEAVVEAFLARRRDFALDPLPPALRDLAGHAAFLRTWPQRHGMDGAFACRLSRAAP